MINYLSIAKTFEDRAYELIDDRAPKTQADGPDDFMARLNDLQTGYYSVINGFPEHTEDTTTKHSRCSGSLQKSKSFLTAWSVLGLYMLR